MALLAGSCVDKAQVVLNVGVNALTAWGVLSGGNIPWRHRDFLIHYVAEIR